MMSFYHSLLCLLLLQLTLLISSVRSYGVDDNYELGCPDECDCHYFRINWVTDCSESNLTDIPYDELSHNVYILDMNGNTVSDIKPMFPRGIKIRRLQVANNELTEVLKEPFAALEYLIDVDLSGNQIRSVQPDAFENCPGLLNVELQENRLTNVDGPFLVSNTLQYLDLSNNNFTELSFDFFTNLTALHTLDMSHNPLRILDQGPFDPLASLESLQLNDCSLTHITDNALFSLEYLKHLELSGNYLTEVDWTMVLGTLYRLEYLDLRRSMITNLPEDTFGNSTWLTTLILAENDLTDLDVATTLGSNLRHLDTLDLSNCLLKGPLSEDAFANATRLKTLNLSGNPLFATDLQLALGPLSNLERLFLSNCGLKQLPDSFETLNRLHELDISRNPLGDAFVKIIAPLNKLKYLNMGHVNLSHASPKTFAKMTSMRKLILSGNYLEPLDAALFANLTQLESLELNNCGLKHPMVFQKSLENFTHTELRELSLAGNPLEITKDNQLLPAQLSRVQRIDISNCNLTHLPDNVFRRTESVTHLNLAGNAFNSQPGGLKFLQLLPKLESLDLGENDLTTITPHVFVKNPRLASLRLVGNPFRCDCNVAEMWDWAAMVKGDLSVLVGSKTSPDDFTLKGAKRRKSLVCRYDEEQVRGYPASVRSVPGRRPFAKPPAKINTANRTWAKYVRESGCEPVVRIIQQPITMTAAGVFKTEMASLGPPAWIVAVFGVTLIVTTGAVAGLLGRQRAQRFARVADSSMKF